MPKERLDKVLAHLGFGTRTEVRTLVRQGAVTVDGAAVRDPGLRLETERHAITVAGQAVAYARHAYLMLNKVAGVVTATQDARDQTVLDLVPAELRRPGLFPVGRLDKDSEGLLLLTTDGELAHRLLGPRWHVPKRYYVRMGGRPGDEAVHAFARGLVLDGGMRTLPAQLEVISAGDPSEALVTVVEGKFHQVKRMFAALGMHVLYLQRVQMGPLALDPTLAPGACRPLTTAEVAGLRGAVGLDQGSDGC